MKKTQGKAEGCWLLFMGCLWVRLCASQRLPCPDGNATLSADTPQCQCYADPGASHGLITRITRIHCQDTRLDNRTAVDILTSLPNSITELNFSGNTIPVLMGRIIRNANSDNFWDLKTIDLSNNSIVTIAGKAFFNAPDLHTLVLDDNDWFVDSQSARVFSGFFALHVLSLNKAFSKNNSHADPDKFVDLFEGSGLHELEELYLEANNMDLIKAAAFQSLPALRQLSLKNNRLSAVSGVWNSTCHTTYGYSGRQDAECRLESLDLSGNQIATIPMSFMDELLRMPSFRDNGQLNVTNNPLSCDCDMADFITWLQRGHVTTARYLTDGASLTCHSPQQVRGVPLVNVTLENNCSDTTDNWVDGQTDGKTDRGPEGEKGIHRLTVIALTFLALVFLLAVVTAIVWCCRRKKFRHKQLSTRCDDAMRTSALT